MYIGLMSHVDYPCIGWMRFCSFCKDCKIVDKHTTFSVIDRCFMAANVEVVDMQDNPDRALQRYEFFETLIRIAQVKFKEEVCISAAFQKLLNDHVLKYYVHEPWQEFRDEQLW